MTKISKAMTILKDFKVTKRTLNFMFSEYLYNEGWFVSFRKKQSLDLHGNPIPWWTYSFNDFIRDRLSKDMDVFEFGSGSSSIYLADKVNSITSVEHDKDWYELVKSKMPSNVKLIFKDLEYGGEYSQAVTNENSLFDIVIVDGRDRVNCCINSVSKLKKNGVLIFDDAHRPEYQESYDYMINQGFKRIDFTGVAAGFFFKKSTSLFYKDDNCLGV